MLTGFNQWWQQQGRLIDPDTEDVPWFDKRQALAEIAFEAGCAGDSRPAGVTFTIPGLTPPSVNHYKVPVKIKTRLGIKTSYAVTPEGKAFKAAVAIFARGATVAPTTQRERMKVRYELRATVYLSKGERGDGDNFWKCIADGLQEAGVIHSDARVRDWIMSVRDEDRTNPRTEITASVIE